MGEQRGSLAFRLCVELHILASLFDHRLSSRDPAAFARLTLGTSVMSPIPQFFIYNTDTACFPSSEMACLDYPHADQELGGTGLGR